MASEYADLVVWDVQHGSAAYVRTPGGMHIAIDLGVGSYGENDAVFSPLLYLKNELSVQSLDGVILTHPHTDHLDDIRNLARLAPRALRRSRHLTEAEVRNGNPKGDQEVVERYLAISSQYTTTMLDQDSPFTAANNGGVDFAPFFPTRCSRSNLNNHSLVHLVSYQGVKVLVPGDNEAPSWDELLRDREFVEAIRGTDVLLAPHHGRDSGFCKELFAYIKPRLTIISDGRFCDTSATDRYCAVTRGCKVHSRSRGIEDRKCVTTRRDGYIHVRVAAGHLEVNCG